MDFSLDNHMTTYCRTIHAHIHTDGQSEQRALLFLADVKKNQGKTCMKKNTQKDFKFDRGGIKSLTFDPEYQTDTSVILMLLQY